MDLNLRELFSQKLDISGKAEQSKAHPFNFHEKLKHSYRAWWKGNKAENIYFVWEVFIKFIQKATKGI